MKKHILILKIAIIFCISISINSIVFAENTVIENTVETNSEIEINKISLSQTEIKLNNEIISEDNTSSIYLEDTEDGLKIINITNPGKYEFSGKAKNLQIAVNVEETEKVEIILNNVQISTTNAPSIIIYKGFEFFVENDAGVIINLLEGTENKITGAFIENENEKYEGAISSNTSLVIKGGGKLDIVAEKEGIETKKNLLINNGNIKIQSKANSIDACLENESTIIINNGTLITSIDKTSNEGSGINSENKIIINGGDLYTSSPAKTNGINAKNSLVINGGNIISTGSIMDKYNKTTSKQLGIYIGFKQEKISGTLITLTKLDKTPIFAYCTERNIDGISYSSESLKEDVYKIFIDGTIIGDLKNNLYTKITTYSPGEEQKIVSETGELLEFKFSRENYKFENLEKVVIQTSEVVEEVAEGDFSAIICLGIALIILIIISTASKKTDEKLNNKK